MPVRSAMSDLHRGGRTKRRVARLVAPLPLAPRSGVGPHVHPSAAAPRSPALAHHSSGGFGAGVAASWLLKTSDDETDEMNRSRSSRAGHHRTLTTGGGLLPALRSVRCTHVVRSLCSGAALGWSDMVGHGRARVDRFPRDRCSGVRVRARAPAAARRQVSTVLNKFARATAALDPCGAAARRAFHW